MDAMSKWNGRETRTIERLVVRTKLKVQQGEDFKRNARIYDEYEWTVCKKNFVSRPYASIL